MAQSSWTQYWPGWLLKTGAAGVAHTPEQYLQLTTQCMEEARMMTLPPDSKSAQVKFNYEQCKYLVSKLRRTVHFAKWFIGSHFHKSLSASREDEAKCLELYKILFMLAEEVECFIQGCSKEHWVQAAVMLTNMSDHVLSLGVDLELCTIFLSSFSKSRCLTLDEVSDVRNAEVQLIKEKAAFIDDGTLLTDVKALIKSDEASSDDCELATFLLERIDRSRQRSLPLGKFELWQLSLYERSDIASLKQMVKIGKGGFATVYRAIWLGAEVAVKTFHGPENPDFKKEVSICARVSHPNITSLLFYGVDSGECSIVMELMDEDLQSLMRSRLRCNRTRGSPFCIFVALDLMLQIAEGMCYLHKMRIVHRDLKSHNILVRCAKSTKMEEHEYVQVKVADFGLSRTKERSMTYSNQTVNMGTTRWMAPEMIKTGRNDGQMSYPFKSDVYSFAMVCYEILTGTFPFSTIHSNVEVKKRILAGDRPQLPDPCPYKLRTLIEKCWNPKASTRPCFADICQELRYLKSLQMTWSNMGTSVASAPPEAASVGGDVVLQPLPETVNFLVGQVLASTPGDTSSAIFWSPRVNYWQEVELLANGTAPASMEEVFLAKAAAIALRKMGVFSTEDKQEFLSSSSFSQPPASRDLAPSFQVSTEAENQESQPDSPAWSEFGGH